MLVLTHPDERGDFVGLAVTSIHAQELAVGIDDESLTEGSLPKPSWVRCDKVFTLSEVSIVKSYGRIHPDVLNKVMKSLCTFLGCD